MKALILWIPAVCLFAQDVADLYRKGVDLQRAGDLTGAVEAYRASLTQDASNIAAHSNLGAALTALGRFDEAIPEYQKAIAGAPAQVLPALKRNLALAYYKSGHKQEAAPVLIALHDAQPLDHDAALLAADCLLQLGEAAKALAILEPLAAEVGSDKALAYALGIAYLKTGKSDDAQRVLDPILKDKASAEGQYVLGMAMFTSGDYVSAVAALRHAVEVNPSLAHLQSYYGQALIFTGDPDAALVAFRKQLDADPNDFESNYETALILLRRRQYAEADTLLRRAEMLRPKSRGAQLALADALIGEKKTREARTELESMVREWPEFGPAHNRLADVYTATGLRAQATRERVIALKYAANSDVPLTGPALGTTAPHFELTKSEGGGTVGIPVVGKPTVLVFGSYTCPNFRKASPVLNDLSQKLEGRISFLQVYIREAHATDQWQSTVNEREKVDLAPVSTLEQKHDYAIMCQRKLHLTFPAVVDGLDNAAEKTYAAWPSRVYVIGADGRVRYSSALTEQDFDEGALKAAIASLLSGAHKPR